jgi:hypothetical protein
VFELMMVALGMMQNPTVFFQFFYNFPAVHIVYFTHASATRQPLSLDRFMISSVLIVAVTMPRSLLNLVPVLYDLNFPELSYSFIFEPLLFFCNLSVF